MQDKFEIRLEAKNKRKTLDIKKISQNITLNIEEFEPYKNAKNILVFYPKENEINILKLTNDKTKNFYLPKINKENLEVCPYKPNDEVKACKFNIFEPVCEAIESSIIDLIIVPCLCADKRGNRVGWGKGYYDRFLKTLDKNVVKIAVCPFELIKESIKTDEFDVACNFVISEK